MGLAGPKTQFSLQSINRAWYDLALYVLSTISDTILNKDLILNRLNSMDLIKILSCLGWIVWVVEKLLSSTQNSILFFQIIAKEYDIIIKTEKSLKKINDSHQKEKFFTTHDWRPMMKKMTSVKSLKSFLVQPVMVFEVF